ncbi:hypothetical protein JS530_08945 [Bifidobacterium sp. LC6]|uniref:Uncharacterized protein n=1 Tax=Bifidobacterium colobi TaxID=2809026 RepID=A0ABS5UWZ3_9BIFI|nr:hypothetical protein [Bifidobacterium colobi]MBT1175619.1 hypothetical protein [Bifidobacterium colobi]
MNARVDQIPAQYLAMRIKQHHDCNEIRQSVHDVTRMLLELADWTIADADANAASRTSSERIMRNVETMALGRYAKLHDLATQCWNDVNGSGYDYDLADPLAYEISQFIADAEDVPGSNAIINEGVSASTINPTEATVFYDAALYCAVAFLLMRADSFTMADLANLCSPEVFTPINDIGEIDATNESCGRYGYEVTRADAHASSDAQYQQKLPASSRVLGLMDKLPDDLTWCGANELGENERDEQYYWNHDKPNDPDWHTVFDSQKYNNAYATLSKHVTRHDDDSWPMGRYFTPNSGDELPTALPRLVDFAMDIALCDLNVAFPGTDQLIPFMTDLDRLRRFVWKNHRAAEYGDTVDFDRIMQALGSFQRRTWVRTTHTATGGNHD